MADELQPSIETVGDFVVFAPGLMLFGVLLFTMTTSTTLTRESESGAMERMRIARAPVGAALGGLAAAQLTLACLAIAAMLFAAHLMGLDNAGTYGALFVVLAVTSSSAIGLGMAVAAFARSREEAANLSLLVAILMGFLSGAFFRLPAVNIIETSSSDVQIYELLASHHAVDALVGVLAGNSLADEATALLALAGLSVVHLLAGGALFAWRRGHGAAAPRPT